MNTQVYGVWFDWSDAEPEWLCDRDDIVFVFDLRDEAEAMAAVLHPGNGMLVEVREYDGAKATRPYPWEGGNLTLEDLQALAVSVQHG